MLLSFFRDESEEPDEDMRMGYLVSFPVHEIDNPEIRIELDFLSSFFNLDDNDTCLGGNVQIYIGSKDCENLYSEGEYITENIIPSIDPGEDEETETEVVIDSENDYYNIVSQGAFRIGIKMTLNLLPFLSSEVKQKKIYTTIADLGIGARIRIGNDFVGAGGRFPVGFCFIIPGVPIDIFIEIVPVLGLYTATVFTGNASIGFRWFF